MLLFSKNQIKSLTEFHFSPILERKYLYILFRFVRKENKRGNVSDKEAKKEIKTRQRHKEDTGVSAA